MKNLRKHSDKILATSIMITMLAIMVLVFIYGDMKA